MAGLIITKEQTKKKNFMDSALAEVLLSLCIQFGLLANEH